MAYRNILEDYMSIPGTKTPITLTITGAASKTINGYYAINNNTAMVYIPQFSQFATSSDYLQTQLPAQLIPLNTVSIIGNVVSSDSSATFHEVQGLISVSQSGVLTISSSPQYNTFTSGNYSGTFTGQTLTYNLN